MRSRLPMKSRYVLHFPSNRMHESRVILQKGEEVVKCRNINVFSINNLFSGSGGEADPVPP